MPDSHSSVESCNSFISHLRTDSLDWTIFLLVRGKRFRSFLAMLKQNGVWRYGLHLQFHRRRFPSMGFQLAFGPFEWLAALIPVFHYRIYPGQSRQSPILVFRYP